MPNWEVASDMQRNLALWIVGSSFVVLIALFIYYGMSKADEAALESCIASIHQAITDAVADSTVKLPVVEEWSYLSADQINQLDESQANWDCGKVTSNKLIDNWGEKIQVLYRYQPRFHSYPPEFRVWSKGRDRRAGTADDIIAPRGSLESVKNLADRWP